MILASQSPRRLSLLEDAGIHPKVRVADIDEAVVDGETPVRLVERLSRLKAEAVLPDAPENEWVVGADTVVVIDGKILGKPHGEAQAKSMLAELAGRTHTVYTGVCMCKRTDSGVVEKGFVEATDVEFWPLSDPEIDAYVKSGEPFDKAGGYGIQGSAKVFVKEIRGNYENVVGLPLSKLVRELGREGSA